MSQSTQSLSIRHNNPSTGGIEPQTMLRQQRITGKFAGVSWRWIAPLASALGMTTCLTAHAQQNLRDATGLSFNEESMRGAIVTVCPQLVSLNNQGQLNQDQANLTAACSAMVNNGTGATGFRFTDDELRDALTQLSDQRNTTSGTMATRLPAGQQIVSARLAALRTGGPQFAFNGQPFSFAQQSQDGEALALAPTGSRGGAAGDEASALVPGLGVFLNGIVNWGELDGTANQTGFDADGYGIVVGADYRFTDELIFGATFNYSNQTADFAQGALSAGGDVDADAFGGSVFGTYYVNDFYVDGIVSISGVDYTIKRQVLLTSTNPAAPSTNVTATGDPGGFGLAISGGAGYEGRYQQWSYTPYIRLDYRQLDIDDYTESGASGLELQVDEQNVDSLIFALGGQITYSISTPFGVVVPRVRAEYNHEFQDDPILLRARYAAPVGLPIDNPDFVAQTDEPNRDFAVVGGGVSAVFARNIQAFIDFDAVVARENVTDNVLTTGVRVDF